MLTKDPNNRISWMELFQININERGKIESANVTNKIMSLEDAKSSKEASSTLSSSSKAINVPRDKSANNEPTTPTTVANFKKTKSYDPNYVNGVSNSNTSGNDGDDKAMLTKEHKSVLEGTRLAMEVIQSKVPNNMGYSYLILGRVLEIISDLRGKTSTNDLRSILDKEIQDIKAELDSINSKMFSYEQKGLEDWRKYMRGKFFEEEKTIHLWYNMINFLNGSSPNYQSNNSTKSMIESIKAILY